MCIGIPMQIIESGEEQSLCEGLGQRRSINTQLVGKQPVGTWVMVFIDSAREVISAEQAMRLGNAVQALEMVMDAAGAPSHDVQQRIDELFADLVDREPPKPASLLALERERGSNS